MPRAASRPHRAGLHAAPPLAQPPARLHRHHALSSRSLSPSASWAAVGPGTTLGWLLPAFISPWVGSTVLAAAPEKLGNKGPSLEVVSEESGSRAERAVWLFQV